jgi:aspartyl-tRNA(Asn)/glutamyl-tRNA(Gln) amidotransferase subunit C
MSITRREVWEIARLCRLALTEAELALYERQLGDILGYMEKLRGLDTTGVVPTTHAVPLCAPLRDDEAVAPLSREPVLAAAPRVRDGAFEVPRIVGGEDP